MHREKYLILKKTSYQSMFLLLVINFDGEKKTLKSKQSYLNPGFVVEKDDKNYHLLWSPKKISASLENFYIFHFYLEFLEKLPLVEPPLMNLFLKALHLLDEFPENGQKQFFLVLSKSLFYLQLYPSEQLTSFYLQGKLYPLVKATESQWEKNDLLYCYRQLHTSFSFKSLSFLQNLFSKETL